MSLWRVPSLVEVKSVHPLRSINSKMWDCWPEGWSGAGAEELGQSKVRRLEELNNP